jgi:nucleoside-diphosphate-sugar epimerase
MTTQPPGKVLVLGASGFIGRHVADVRRNRFIRISMCLSM